MNYNKIWTHIFDNKPFYTHLSLVGGFKINMEDRIHYDLSSSGWNADPILFIVQCFRKYDVTVGGDMAKDEYAFIRKYLLSRGVALPFSRTEYNEYILRSARSNTILSVLETDTFSSDNIFLIPSREVAHGALGVAFEYISALSSDLFLYGGLKARCVVDIYDSIVGFEVYTERGNVFVPMYGTIQESSYVRSSIRRVPRDKQITVFMDNGTPLPSYDGFISVPIDTTSSVEKVSKYFSTFNIDSDDFDFVLNVSAEMSRMRDSIHIVVNGDVSISDYLADRIVVHAAIYKESTYGKMFKHILKMSSLTSIDKEIIIAILEKSEVANYLDSVILALRVSPDRLAPKIRDMVLDSSLSVVSKQPSMGGDGGSIKVFNKVGKYFKDIPMEARLLAKHIVPELGGYAFIERYCDITGEIIPSRFKTIESFIQSSIVGVMHEQYLTAPQYRGSLGLGVHHVDGVAVFNSGADVYGREGKRSVNGVIFEYSDVEFLIPITKPTIKEVSTLISSIKKVSSTLFHVSDSESDMFSLLLVSTLIAPLLDTSSRLMVQMKASTPYRESEIKDKLFRGVFKAVSIVSIVNSDKYAAVGESGTVTTVLSIGKKDLLPFKRKLMLRDTEDVILGGGFGSKKLARQSPLFVFTAKDILFDDFVSFNFNIRAVMRHDRLSVPNDVSPQLISYVIKTAAVFRRAEEDLQAIKNDKVKEVPLYLIDEYLSFFSKIISAMVLCSHVDTGYSPLEFHDIMFKKQFLNRPLSERINVKALILELVLSQGTVMDKIKDKEYRMNEKDDKLAFVDKAFHIRYSARPNTKVNIVLFNRRRMFRALKKQNMDATYREFTSELDATKGVMTASAASSSYCIGRNRSTSIMAKYVEIHGEDREEFGVMRYDDTDDILG